MKRVLQIIVFCGLFFLVACGNQDVGIIGGADGPTSIYIKE